MIEGIKHVYFFSKEPCDFTEWKDRVEISFPNWLSDELLYKFSLIVQQKLRRNHVAAFSEDVIKLKDGVEMNSKLATEVVKKLVYFLFDDDIDKLLYELQESHSKFSSETFSKEINDVFSANNQSYESDISTRNDTTNTFRKIFIESGAKVKSVNKTFIDSIVPSGFVTITAFYRPSRYSKKEKKPFFSNATSEKDAVFNFYKAIEQKKFPEAYAYLNSNLQSNRWDGKVERFADGYHNLVHQKLINVSPIENNMGKGWLVYFQADVLAYVLDENGPIEDIVRKGIGTFDVALVQHRIDRMREMVIDCDGDMDRFNTIPFFRFIQPNFIDDVRWVTRLSPEQVGRRFKTKRTLIHSCYNVFCQEEAGVWYITKLSVINFNGFPLR